MNFSCRTFASSGNAWPCDIDFAVDPVVGVAIAFGLAVVGLGLIAAVYLLAKGRAS